ncbi:MAG: integrase family protein, partial [Phenylobacterium sp.]|nr:integrase family protein [Phenylobacterium sp.]
MLKQLKITDRVAVKLECPAGKRNHLFPDVSGNGLCLQVTEAGSRKWKFRYDHAGRRNFLHDIGDSRLVAYEDAKLEAARLSRELKINKRSPKSVTYDPKTASTFNDLLDGHLATLSESTQENLKTKLKGMRDEFGKEPIVDVSRARLVAYMDRKWADSPGTAEVVRRNLCAAFNKALDQDSDIKLPEGFVNPASKMKRALKCLVDHAPQSRAVAYESDELQVIFGAMQQGYADPNIGDIGVACLELILLTGARPLEIQSLRWDQVDEVPGEPDLRYIIKQRHKTWKKTGRPRRIVVNQLGIRVLERASKWRQKDSPYVFPPRRIQVNTKSPFFTSDTELCVILSKKVGFKFRPGSFRSAYINFMLASLELEEAGVTSLYDALEVVAENVGHTDVRVTLEHYRKGRT